MAQDRIAAAAAAVAENRLTGRRLGRLAGLETLEDGYAAQQEANRALEQRLGARVGHKIGGTTAPMRAYINVPEPIGGEVFASTVHGSGTVLPLGQLRAARGGDRDRGPPQAWACRRASRPMAGTR